MKSVFLFYAVMIVAVITFKVGLFGSLITSSVKSIAGSCGTSYGIESIPVISGNWFCPGTASTDEES